VKYDYNHAKKRNEERETPSSNDPADEYVERVAKKRAAKAKLKAKFEAGELDEEEYQEGLRFINNVLGRDERMKDW
jgi:hypothetical protein